ncbi:MAG: leucyl aminopeptidase [Anaerolineae bacterium]|nr:leucyl aminopeptidase [Anaerolineae bacterium]
MEIKLFSTSALQQETDALVLYLFENETTFDPLTSAIDQALNHGLQDLFTHGDFTGKSAQIALIYPRGSLSAKRVMFIGLGQRADLKLEGFRRAVASSVKKARELKLNRVAAILPFSETWSALDLSRAFAEGAHLGAYIYQGQKSETTEELPAILELFASDDQQSSIETGVKEGSIIASGTITTRNLVNLPPNICTPTYLSSVARNVADRAGLKITVLDKDQIEELHMGALLAVAQGSDTPPRFIILEHHAAQTELPTIVLIGKGVTFDTGGYNLKTGEGMIGMKADMAGGAAVIGAMQIIGMLNLPLRVVGLIPASDNMISSTAFRPQEVVTASNGKTIEIISTDAEGRLLLADALVYAKRYNPAAVVDIATLTGACIVALGSAAAGFFCTDDHLRDLLQAAGNATHERLWQLPLYPEYKKAIESDTADMKNTGGRNSGVGTSAVFLQQFIDYPAWAHIDMAGVMLDLADNPYIPAKGGSGYGARLLAEFVRLWGEKS